MLKSIVNSAARLAVVILNTLAERIDRAGQKVVRSNKRSGPGVNVGVMAKKGNLRNEFKRNKSDADANNTVLAKLNLGRSKDLQHNIPTARHN